MQYLVEIVGAGGQPSTAGDSGVVSGQAVEELFSQEFKRRREFLGEKLVSFSLVRPGVIFAVFED